MADELTAVCRQTFEMRHTAWYWATNSPPTSSLSCWRPWPTPPATRRPPGSTSRLVDPGKHMVLRVRDDGIDEGRGSVAELRIRLP